jgi:hypothetical protein
MNEQAKVPESQLFRFLMGTHNRGSAEHEASVAINEVVAAIRETKRKGKVTLEVAMEPVKGDVNRLSIEVKVTAKVPKPSPASDVFYSTEEGGLQKTDPNQMEFSPAFAKAGENKAAAPVAKAS